MCVCVCVCVREREREERERLILEIGYSHLANNNIIIIIKLENAFVFLEIF